MGTGRKNWEDWAGVLARLAINHCVTTLDEKVVKQLLFAVSFNHFIFRIYKNRRDIEKQQLQYFFDVTVNFFF
jgi:hypothetical protein